MKNNMGTKIKDLFNIYPKSKRNAAFGNTEGKYPFFTSSNIVDRFVNEFDYFGEFLIIGDGGSGNVKYYNGAFSASDHNFLLKPKDGCNSLCVYYFLKKNNYEVLNNGFKGTGIKNISKNYIKEITYSHNSKYSEEFIVKTLSKIENEIANENKYVLCLNDLIKSRFKEMFLSRKGLPKRKWADVLTIYNGRDYKKNVSNETEGFPVYGSGGFMYVYADRFICEGTLIIIGRKGTIDRPILVKGKIWNIDTAFGIKTDSKVLNPVFFYYRSKFYDYKDMNKQTTKPSLTKSDLLKLDIELPSMNEQRTFVDFVEQADKLKFSFLIPSKMVIV